MLLKDTAGQKSLTATLSVVTFVVVMIKVLFGGGSIKYDDYSFSFGTIDAASIAALLGATLGAYSFRRHTMATYPADPEPSGRNSGDDEEEVKA